MESFRVEVSALGVSVLGAKKRRNQGSEMSTTGEKTTKGKSKSKGASAEGGGASAAAPAPAPVVAKRHEGPKKEGADTIVQKKLQELATAESFPSGDLPSDTEDAIESTVAVMRGSTTFGRLCHAEGIPSRANGTDALVDFIMSKVGHRLLSDTRAVCEGRRVLSKEGSGVTMTQADFQTALKAGGEVRTVYGGTVKVAPAKHRGSKSAGGEGGGDDGAGSSSGVAVAVAAHD